MIYFFYYPLPTMQILKVKSMDIVLISKYTAKKLFLYFLVLWEAFLKSKVNGQSTNIKGHCKEIISVFFGSLGTIFGAKQTLGRFPKMLVVLTKMYTKFKRSF